MLYSYLSLVLVIGGALGAAPARNKPYYPAAAHAQLFIEFKTTYSKQYASPQEEQLRFAAFKRNLAEINELNALDEHATYDLNEFADMTEEEIETRYPDIEQVDTEMDGIQSLMLGERFDPLPKSFDYRDQGKVSRVKDQKNCNAGYAFAFTGAIETDYAMRKNTTKIVEFSEQQIIDCGKAGGCKGASPLRVCHYYFKNGAMKEDDYKYVGQESKCAYKKDKVATHTECVNFWYLTPLNETIPQHLLHYFGPLTTMIDSRPFQWYKSGIITQCAFKGYNHAVLATGWGEEKGVKFWSLKNSRGEKWGENGYVRIQRGVLCLGIGGNGTMIHMSTSMSTSDKIMATQSDHDY